jgi:hypothetical protein
MFGNRVVRMGSGITMRCVSRFCQAHEGMD